MTDRNDIARQIEELLGSDGSPELAQKLFVVLVEQGYVTFDPACGYELAAVDDFAWLDLLDRCHAVQATGCTPLTD